MAAPHNTTSRPFAKVCSVIVGLIAGAIAGAVFTGVLFLESFGDSATVILAASICTGIACAILAGLYGQRFWEKFKQACAALMG